jgi:23S rRNA (guanosine2251-2'-O)-methyltransferase
VHSDGAPPLIVVLDGVQDPHNLGAIIRSAYVLGAHGVVIPEHRAAAITPAVTKSSAGATERMRIARVANLLRAIDGLRERGLRVLAAAADRGKSLAEADLRGPLALVVGAEGRGLREAVARRADGLLRIPQRGHIASLNASVAGAILLYEVLRKRSG